jgi:NAD(P)H-hydrate repair Nnr-like enzyme with NAD(P)H-hydrate dehydratase domain
MQKGSKIDQAQAAAQASGCGVIFKGADTVVALPDGTTWVAAGASPWLATAGTGDVLAGIAGTMLARGLDASRAAQASVWLHNRAANLAGPGLIADDLLGCLAPALAMAR